MPHLLAIDQGTTSSRAILFNDSGDIEKISQQELKLYYPQDGWVEQDAEEIWNDTVSCIEECLEFAQSQGFTVAGAGITNQRETVILWDKETGNPVYNAIVWQDRRTSQYCKTLKEQGVEGKVTSKTGLLLDPYFSATKIKWVLDNVEGARTRAQAGGILCGTIDSFLLWRLTRGKLHATDATNASRTMLCDVQTMEWDDELLELFDIPKAILPEIRENISDYGFFESDSLGLSVAIGGVAGDQQAALIGQSCFKPAMVKSTYGTGCFMLMNIGQNFVQSKNRLLTTVAYVIDGEVTYALEGSIFNAGTAVQFLRDNLGLITDAGETDSIARTVDDNGGVYFVPAFTGLGAPYWNPEAKGVLYGFRRDTGKEHIVRAALEAQAYQTRDLIDAMESDSDRGVRVIRADGGLVANSFVCEFLANVTQARVDVPRVREATAWGAAMLAGVRCGVFKNLEDAAQTWQPARTYDPQMTPKQANLLYTEWKKAVTKA